VTSFSCTPTQILASLIAAEFTPWDPHSAFLKLFSQLELMVAINREFLLRFLHTSYTLNSLKLASQTGATYG